MKLMSNGFDISETDYQCLRNDLLDVDDWLVQALRGKISQCKKRLIAEWHTRLMLDPSVDTYPAQVDKFITFVTSRADYQDRVTRESED